MKTLATVTELAAITCLTVAGFLVAAPLGWAVIAVGLGWVGWALEKAGS